MGQILTYPLTSKLMQRHGNESMRVGVSEMQGYRVNMEDQHTVRLSLSKKHPTAAFFSVFDGHAGDRASVYLAQTLADRVGALENPSNAQQLTECMLALDADFLTRVDERGHGSTSVFAVVEPLPATASGAGAAAAADAKAGAEGKRQWRITVGNIGDSRAVLIRKNGECIGMTEDHKPNAAAEAERIRAAGGYVSSNRVDGQLAMSRAIGDWSYKGDTTLPATKQKVIAVPDITVQTAEEGDILLVCCDGIVEQMKNEDAAQFITQDVAANGKDPATMCARLLEHALKSGSKDNMTAMIVQFGVDGRAYDTPKDEYVPGPYYQDNREFVDAFKTDARRHGLAGAELEAFIGKAMALPKEPTRGGGGGGMGGLANLLARSAGGAGPSGDDDDDDDRPQVFSGGGGAGGPGGVLDLNGLSQRDQLRALMELLQKSGGGPVAMDDDEDDDDDRPAPAARKPGQGAAAGAKNGGAAGGAAGGAGASGDGKNGAAAGAGAGPAGKSAKKNAKKRAKKKVKAAQAAAAAASPVKDGAAAAAAKK